MNKLKKITKVLLVCFAVFFIFSLGLSLGGKTSKPSASPKALEQSEKTPESQQYKTSEETINVQQVKAAPTPTATPIPTLTPTVAPVIVTPAPQPTSAPVVQPTIAPVQQTQTTQSISSWGCDCSKTCTQISSCAEAQYLLNTCGCSKRDADHDGIACDGAPLNCQ